MISSSYGVKGDKLFVEIKFRAKVVDLSEEEVNEYLRLEAQIAAARSLVQQKESDLDKFLCDSLIARELMTREQKEALLG